MEKPQSSFSVTCNLLSQFIREKGRSFSDLPVIGKPETYRVPPTTISLLPGVDVSGDVTKDDVAGRNATRFMELFPQRAGLGVNAPVTATATADERQSKKSQLTMFYKGKVLVFDNFPAEKATELMMLAGKASSANYNNDVGFAPPAPSSVVPTEIRSLSTSPVSSVPPVAQRSCPPRAIASDLPIARKASLHRFLEKRKDRINTRAPYQMNQEKVSPDSAVTSKIEEKNLPWLGLNPSLSSHSSR